MQLSMQMQKDMPQLLIFSLADRLCRFTNSSGRHSYTAFLAFLDLRHARC